MAIASDSKGYPIKNSLFLGLAIKYFSKNILIFSSIFEIAKNEKFPERVI